LRGCKKTQSSPTRRAKKPNPKNRIKLNNRSSLQSSKRYPKIRNKNRNKIQWNSWPNTIKLSKKRSSNLKQSVLLIRKHLKNSLTLYIVRYKGMGHGENVKELQNMTNRSCQSSVLHMQIYLHKLRLNKPILTLKLSMKKSTEVGESKILKWILYITWNP
jgi:hypothetical protein